MGDLRVAEWFLSCLRFLKPDLQMLLNLNQQVFEGLRIGFKKIKIKNLNLNQTEAT